MDKIKRKGCLPLKFEEGTLKGILPNNMELKINPFYDYFKHDDSTYVLALKIIVENYSVEKMKTYTATSECEMDIEAKKGDKIIKENSTEFITIFTEMYLAQINMTIDFLNEKTIQENIPQIQHRTKGQIESPIRTLLGLPPLN